MTDGNTTATSLNAVLPPLKDKRSFMDYTMKLLLAVFFFLLPLQTRYFFREVSLYEYGTLSVFLVEILGWVIILLGLIKIQGIKIHEYKNIKILRSPLFLYSCIFIFLGFTSIAWAPDKVAALQAAVRLFEGVLLYCIVQSLAFARGATQKLSFNWVAYAFFAGAMLQAVLGIYQFLTQSAFASTILGMALHDPIAAGTSVVEFADERWLRAYGGLPHPNVLGGYLVVALAFALYLIRRVNISKPQYYLLLTTYFLLLTGIFFSFSRAAWLATIGLLSYWVIKLLWQKQRHSEGAQRPKNPVQKETGSLATLGMTVLYVAILAFVFRPLVATRVMSTSGSRLEAKSRVERVEGMRESWQLIKKQPVLGVGIGNYTQAVAREVRPDDPLYTYQPAHNVFLLVWAELGLAGLALFVAVLYFIFKQSKFYILHFTFLILLLFDHYLWSLPFGTLLFWSVMGMLQSDTPLE